MKVFWTYPDIGREEIKTVKEVLKSGMISYGKLSYRFEEELASYIGCKHVIVANNGTSGLVAALMALNIKKDDEVIVPTYTFVATANVVLAVGATPVFADVDETFNIDVKKVEEKITNRTRAIIGVDVAGMPCNLRELRKVCNYYQLALIEDAAESLGAEYENKKVGNIYSDVTIFSFHSSKIVTTGEGGAVATNDDQIAHKSHLIVRQGFLGGVHYEHECFGLNFKLTDIQSGIGICQLKKIEEYISNRTSNAKRYKSALTNLGVEYQRCTQNTRPVWWIFQALFKDKEQRDKILQSLLNNGIEAKVCWKPLHLQPHLSIYNQNNEKFPCAEDLASRVISLPTGNKMPAEHVDYVIKQIKLALQYAH